MSDEAASAPTEATLSSHTAAEASTSTGEPVMLSKNAAKKLARQQAWEASKLERRAREKEKKKEKREEKRRLIEAGLLDAEELESKKKKRAVIAEELEPFDATIVCDLAFDDLMIDKEVKSMSSQVGFCYAANRATRHPVRLLYTSYGGKMKQRLEGPNQGQCLNWKGVQFWPESYEELWSTPPAKSPTEADEREAKRWRCSKENVVYLTGDSPNTLEALEPGKAYILGGIVDRNRYKNLCLDKANAQGLAHAALPIGQHLPEMTSRKVLTVNQVFEIMIRWIETRDWGEAIRTVMPTRKLHPNEPASETNSPVADKAKGSAPVYEADEDDE